MAKNKLTITRLLDAPRERVWAACTQVEQLAQWWGQPKGATAPAFEGDMREDSWLRFEVSLPDNSIIRAKAHVLELTKPERIVMESYFTDESGEIIDSVELPASRIILLLREVGPRTELTVFHEMPAGGVHTIEQYEEGWTQTLDHLEDVIANEGASNSMESKKALTIERVYDAAQEVVWQAWTDSEKLKQWWGPDNVSIPECDIDLRVGGRFYIVMEAGAAMGPYKGTRWSMEAMYTTVEENERLVYAGKGWTEGDKEATLIDQTTDLTFSDEIGKTKLTLSVTVHSTGPKAGMAIQGMEAGFSQQLDKLKTYLQK